MGEITGSTWVLLACILFIALVLYFSHDEWMPIMQVGLDQLTGDSMGNSLEVPPGEK
jgi:hypothetical protein